MASKNHLNPKTITDKNGKRTTVYVAGGSATPEVAEKRRKRAEAAAAQAIRYATGPATLAPPAPAVDGRGFKDDGTHAATGTRFDSDGFDARGWNTDGIHHATGTRFGPHGIDSRGFTEFGDNLFTAHGEFDANGYDFDGWREDAKNAYTGEIWNRDGLMKDGRFVADALYSSASGSFTSSSDDEVDISVWFKDGQLIAEVEINPNYNRQTTDVWEAISDPEMYAVKSELSDIRTISELTDERATEAAKKINQDSEEYIGGSAESAEGDVLQRLSSAWGVVTERATGLAAFKLPEQLQIDYRVLPIDLVAADDVRAAWEDIIKRDGYSLDFEMPLELQPTFDEAVEAYIENFERINHVKVDEQLREHITDMLWDWDDIVAPEPERGGAE